MESSSPSLLHRGLRGECVSQGAGTAEETDSGTGLSEHHHLFQKIIKRLPKLIKKFDFQGKQVTDTIAQPPKQAGGLCEWLGEWQPH